MMLNPKIFKPQSIFDWLNPMKHLISILLLTFVIGACAPKTYPPELAKLYNTNMLVNTIGTLQNSAIGLNSQKLLSDTDTRVIVTFSVTSLKLIRDQGLDWKVKVTDLIKGLKDSGLSQSVLDTFASSITTLDLIMVKI
jgi:hypothetical protein